MPEIKISIKDDNKSLVGSLEKRTKLLEKMLSKMSSSKNEQFSKVIDVMKKNKDVEQKYFNKMIDSFSGAMNKMKEQKIIINNDGNKSMTSAISKRMLLLEQLIRKKKNQNTVVKNIIKVPEKKEEKKITNINILQDSIRARNLRVVPSPS